jgi:hypothetical protein
MALLLAGPAKLPGTQRRNGTLGSPGARGRSGQARGSARNRPQFDIMVSEHDQAGSKLRKTER